jgi:hypothetical protein
MTTNGVAEIKAGLLRAIRIVLLVPVGISFLSGIVFGQTGDDETRLRNFLSSESHSSQAIRSAEKEIPKLCLEVGEKAIPMLWESVSNTLKDPTHTNAEVANVASDCLVKIGGPEVVKLFKKIYTESEGKPYRDGAKWVLCWAIQSASTPQDIQFLIDSLEGPVYGPERLIPSAAAYGLAVLKPQAAKQALEKRAEEYKNTLPEEVKFALARINGPEWDTPQADSASGTDLLILAVLRFGVPHLDISDNFLETKTGRFWKRDGNAWRYDNQRPKDGSIPSISFDVFVTKDQKRAICSVGIHCGNVCGYGYDFVLRNTKDGWRVVGLFPTWIS